jgi:hypothetical protein
MLHDHAGARTRPRLLTELPQEGAHPVESASFRAITEPSSFLF